MIILPLVLALGSLLMHVVFVSVGLLLAVWMFLDLFLVKVVKARKQAARLKALGSLEDMLASLVVADRLLTLLKIHVRQVWVDWILLATSVCGYFVPNQVAPLLIQIIHSSASSTPSVATEHSAASTLVWTTTSWPLALPWEHPLISSLLTLSLGVTVLSVILVVHI